MTQEQFSQLLRDWFVKIAAVLDAKGKEYTRQDRLSNFKVAAHLQRCTPEKACMGMLAKHLVSIADLVNDLDSGRVAGKPMWEEKIGDAINYLILLDALVNERDMLIAMMGDPH